MTFWGTEVKPAKPYTHLHDSARGRLRISQATLGIGKAGGKSVVQCNVGKKSPVLLCSLIPDVAETTHLELEFEETDEVVFSVIGQRSVHLSGYFLRPSLDNGGDDTDSYGEDIGDSDEGSEGFLNDSEDEYESDFIDDGDVQMFSTSPMRKSSVVIEEISDDEKPANGNAKRHNLKKKHQVSDSDDDKVESHREIVVKDNRSSIFESEDEDGFPISPSSKKDALKDDKENTVSNDKKLDEDRKRKIDAISQDPGSARESCQPSDVPAQPEIEILDDGKRKKKKKEKDRKLSKGGHKSPVEESKNTDNNQVLDKNEDSIIKDDPVQPGEANIDGAEKDVEPKKKKEDKEIGSPVAEGSRKLKKKNKKKKGKEETPQNRTGESAETIDESASKDNQQKMALDKLDSSDEQQKSKETEEDHDEFVASLPGKHPESSANPSTKKKKKKKKNKGEKDLNKNLESAEGKTDIVEGTDNQNGARPLNTREFSNGLVIEELSMGEPDGKRASSGNQVFVHYVGRLKNGEIFDSSSKRKPFSFRLGIGEVIMGWDVGVKGMRVGDKRRLTVPPSMGYGEKGAGNKIPGNSWLVFDVELVNVKGR